MHRRDTAAAVGGYFVVSGRVIRIVLANDKRLFDRSKSVRLENTDVVVVVDPRRRLCNAVQVVAGKVGRIGQLHATGPRRLFSLSGFRAGRLVEQKPVHVHVFSRRGFHRDLFLGAAARQQTVEKTLTPTRDVRHGNLVDRRVQVAGPDCVVNGASTGICGAGAGNGAICEQK